MPAILGGGLAGLTAAYYLLRQGIKPITIYESSNRVGGWIRTERHADKGFIFESGPRTIRPRGSPGSNTLELMEDLGLGDDIIPITAEHSAAKNRMIYVNKQLCLLPNSLGGIFTKVPPFSKPLALTLFGDLFRGRNKNQMNDESIYDFVNRRFGQELADYAISPMICGICAGDAKEISVKFLLSEIFRKEQKYGGILRGLLLDTLNPFSKSRKPTYTYNGHLIDRAKEEKWSIYTLRGGLETLPQALVNYLKAAGVEIRMNTNVKDLRYANGIATININGNTENVDSVISALPSHSLAKVVEGQHPSLSAYLRNIPYVDVAVVNLQYEGNLLKENGFGLLVPPTEQLPILGVIFDSCCIDMNGNTVLTVMMGGKWFRSYFGENPSQKQLLDIATKQIEFILGITKQPKLARVNILRKCIPQYVVGHEKTISSIHSYLNKMQLPLILCGAPYYGVGVNDVILSSRKAADLVASNPDFSNSNVAVEAI